MYISKNQKGVTLVELILSIALILIVLQVAYSLFFVGSDSFAVSTNKGFSQQGVRNTNIFLESEFKYANNFYSEQDVIDGIPNTDFYSMKMENNFLVVSKYQYISGSIPADYIIEEIKRFSSDNSKILVSNKNMGLITIELDQIESSGRKTSNFNLEHTIYLDDGSILSDLAWELTNEENIIYYSKTQDAIQGSIILKGTADGDQNEEDSETKPSTITLSEPIVKVKNGNNMDVITPINGIYYLGNNNNYEITLTYEYNGENTLKVDASSTTQLEVNKAHNESNKVITVTGTSPKNNGPDITITLRLSTSDAESVNRTITISS